MQYDSVHGEPEEPQFHEGVPQSFGREAEAGAVTGETDERPGRASPGQFAADWHEGQRAAREIRNQLGTKLVALEIELAALEHQLALDAATRAKVHALHARFVQVTHDIQRISRHFHPVEVEDRGLAAALEAYCLDFSAWSKVKTEFTSTGVPEVLPNPVALCLYRVVQEALQNVAKHSGSHRAIVALRGSPGSIQVAVRDWGRGFDPSAPECKRGIGLAFIRERARLAGGTYTLRSGPGRGTRILVCVPWSAAQHKRRASA